MPFTPFHFGPGILVKSVAPRRFSFLVFIAIQVLIDFETLWNLMRGNPRLHTFFHSYLGALLISVLIFVFRHKLVALAKRINFFRRTLVGSLAPDVLVFSVVVGAFSHVLLDSLMHADLFPFAPFSLGNNFQGQISLIGLHLGCIISGAIGGIIIVFRIFKLKFTSQ
jgi:hypothetical protein